LTGLHKGISGRIRISRVSRVIFVFVLFFVQFSGQDHGPRLG
jgi:hypothetical protein